MISMRRAVTMNAANDVTVNLITAIRFFCHVPLRIPLPRGAVWSHTGCGNSANTAHWTNVGLMLDRRRRPAGRHQLNVGSIVRDCGNFHKTQPVPNRPLLSQRKTRDWKFPIIVSHMTRIIQQSCRKHRCRVVLFLIIFQHFEARHGHQISKIVQRKLVLMKSYYKNELNIVFWVMQFSPNFPIILKTPTPFDSRTRILWFLQKTGMGVVCVLRTAFPKRTDLKKSSVIFRVTLFSHST